MMLHVQAMLVTLCEVPKIQTHAYEFNRQNQNKKYSECHVRPLNTVIKKKYLKYISVVTLKYYMKNNSGLFQFGET